jgi:hypothetical protein
MRELEWLEELELGGVIRPKNERFSAYRRCNDGSWVRSDEAYNPNCLGDITSSPSRFPCLRRLNCAGTDLSDLKFLADLCALQSLDCSGTPVADLTPPWPGSPPCSPSTAAAPGSLTAPTTTAGELA